MTWDAECVVVGGGIGGAVLALALGRAGRRVLILERDTAPPTIARPEILAGATMDVFERLGVAEQVNREAAIPLEGLELFEAGERTRLFTVTHDMLQRVCAPRLLRHSMRTPCVCRHCAKIASNCRHFRASLDASVDRLGSHHDT